MDDQVTKVNNIVHSFRYQSTNFDKKGYLGYLKGTLTHLPLSPHTDIWTSCRGFHVEVEKGQESGAEKS